MFNRRLIQFAGASAAALIACALDVAPAAAQQLEEVIVTARRTEEKLQDAPVSVAAFSSAAIARQNIENLTDLSRLTPGLTFEGYSTAAYANAVVRGTTQLRNDAADQNVSTFFDGIYLPRQYVADLGVLDLERVEVVKGPQSALYGRSAFAGAINYIPRTPTDAFTARAYATIGTYDRRDVSATVSGPIIGDKLTARIGAGYSEFDGSVKNPSPLANRDYGDKASTGRLGGYEKSNFFAQIRARPIEQLEINLSYYKFNAINENSSNYRLQATDGALNCGGRLPSGNFRLYCGELTYREGEIDPRGYGFTLSSHIFRAAADYKITPDLTLSYLHGQLRADVDSLYNADSSPSIGVRQGAAFVNTYYKTPAGSTEMNSDEVRLRYASGPLSLTGGYYHQLQRDVDNFSLRYYAVNGLPLAAQTPILTLFLTNGALPRTEIDAVFGQVTYRFLDNRASIDLQGRYTEEDKSVRPSPKTTTLLFQKTFKYFTPRVSVDYKVTPNSLIYVSAARGVKSGGFNNTVFIESQRAYDPDTNWTYEIGTKNTFLDRRLRLNAALFYIDWIGIQTNVAVLGVPAGVIAPALIGNGAGVTVPGGELEVDYVVGGGLTVNGSLSYQRARFKDAYVSQRFKDLGLCVGSTTCPVDGRAGGNNLPRSPDLQFTVGGSYDREFSDSVKGFVRADFGYQSKQFTDEMGLTYLPARPVANASTGVTMQDGRYEIQLWAKNIFDEKYVTATQAIFSATESQYAPSLGARRTIGLTGRFNY